MVEMLIVILCVIMVFGAIDIFYSVKNYTECVVERCGKFLTVRSAGSYIKLPFIDKVVATVDMSNQRLEIKKEPVISADNITLYMNFDILFRVHDTKTFVYSATNPKSALEVLVITIARNIVGHFDSGQMEAQIQLITRQIQDTLEEAAYSYGVTIEQVSLTISQIS